MKIYILYGQNDGTYDLYDEWIEGIYLTKGNANKEAKRLNKQKKKDLLGFNIKYFIKEYITKD